MSAAKNKLVLVNLPLSIYSTSTPYWQRRGWRQSGGSLSGHYQTGSRRFRGKIRHCYGTHYEYFVFDPPTALLRSHPKKKCITWETWGAYAVHFHNEPASIDAGIHSVEHLLTEAIRLEKGG